MWEHVWKECANEGKESVKQEKMEEVLGEKREGERWLRKLEKLRGGREE